jgi:hypothetical protein
MRPRSDPKSRAAAIRELKESRALQPTELEGQRLYVIKTKAKAAELLTTSSEPSGFLGGVAVNAFSLCAGSLIVRDRWSDESLQNLSIAIELTEAIAQWHEAIGSPKHDTDEYTADNSGTLLAHSVWTAFLQAHLGQWERAKRMAAYLLGYVRGGAFRIPDPEMEADYLSLFEVLLRAIADDAWPTVLPESLGPYRALIQSRNEPVDFDAALVAVTDLRMARQCGYAQVNDARALPPSAPPRLMGNFEFIAIPAELWAIQALASRLDGLTLGLDADHPWLRAGFAQAPDRALPDARDELLTEVRRRARGFTRSLG